MNNCYADLAAREHQHEEGVKTAWEIEVDRRFQDFVADEDKVAKVIWKNIPELAGAFCRNDDIEPKLVSLIYAEIEKEMCDEQINR